MNTRIHEMKKVILHLHLDGALRPETVRKWLEEDGKTLSLEDVKSRLMVNKDCKNLNEYLEKFDIPSKVLQTADRIERATYELYEDLSKQNVIYAEIRFAPMLSVTERMDCHQVIAALIRGLEKGKKENGVSFNVITCLMRHHTVEQNLSVLEAAKDFLGKGVCAADLAGAEAIYPMSQFMELFSKAAEMGIPFTIHAGECGSVENILNSVEAGAKRIGHGIAMRGNKEIQRLIKEKEIGIEMCPISNLQTKSVKSPSEYPIREFLEEGLLVTVNTDNRTVSSSSLTKELEFIQKTYGISDRQIIQIMKNAIMTTFLAIEEKEKLLWYFINNL